MKIRFESENALPHNIEAASEYHEIWEVNQREIIELIDQHLIGLSRNQNFVCVVGDFPSHSGRSPKDPMRLRSTYPHDQKIGFLVHELCHRALFGREGAIVYSDIHYLLNPCILVILKELIGQPRAMEHVKFECALSPRYDQCWKRTLAHSVEQLVEVNKTDIAPPTEDSILSLHHTVEQDRFAGPTTPL